MSCRKLLRKLDKLFKVELSVSIAVQDVEHFLDEAFLHVVAEAHGLVHFLVHPVQKLVHRYVAAGVHVDLGKVPLVVVGHHCHKTVQVHCCRTVRVDLRSKSVSIKFSVRVYFWTPGTNTRTMS